MSPLPPRVRAEVRRILDAEARRLLADPLNGEAIGPAATRRDGDPLDGGPDQRPATFEREPVPSATVFNSDQFAGKYSLDFTLLADADHAVADAYGTWAEKRMYGKKYWGVRRSTFIVDADGRIAHVIGKASSKTHYEVVLAALAEL